MKDDILRDLVGRQVEVRSQFGNGEGVDVGVLESYNLQWICIKRDSGQPLYFSIANVRLLKPLG